MVEMGRNDGVEEMGCDRGDNDELDREDLEQ